MNYLISKFGCLRRKIILMQVNLHQRRRSQMIRQGIKPTSEQLFGEYLRELRGPKLIQSNDEKEKSWQVFISLVIIMGLIFSATLMVLGG